MKKVIALLLFLLLPLTLASCQKAEEAQPNANEVSQDGEENPALTLSEHYIRISADENTAVFQLYDTAAAEELYEQLPLTLDTENFRSAQWMFYPPERLTVTAAEAYHNGVKGELSYYKPWGDVFILYEDFYAGDEMHRLGICTSGIEILEAFDKNVTLEKLEE